MHTDSKMWSILKRKGHLLEAESKMTRMLEIADKDF